MKRFLHFAAAGCAVLALACGASPAKAGVITSLSDNFDSENGGTPTLNYYGFTNFTVGKSPYSHTSSPGSVDLIGNGSFDAYPGHGLYVDMCGTTNSCGSLTSKNQFAAGTYQVSLELGGVIYSQDAYGTTGVNVTFGNSSVDVATTPLSITNFTEIVTLATAGYLTIADLAQTINEDVGATLLSVNVSAVPVPAALPMFGAALIGLGGLARRRKRAAAV